MWKLVTTKYFREKYVGLLWRNILRYISVIIKETHRIIQYNSNNNITEKRKKTDTWWQNSEIKKSDHNQKIYFCCVLKDGMVLSPEGGAARQYSLVSIYKGILPSVVMGQEGGNSCSGWFCRDETVYLPPFCKSLTPHYQVIFFFRKVMVKLQGTLGNWYTRRVALHLTTLALLDCSVFFFLLAGWAWTYFPPCLYDSPHHVCSLIYSCPDSFSFTLVLHFKSWQ